MKKGPIRVCVWEGRGGRVMRVYVGITDIGSISITQSHHDRIGRI